MPKNVSLALEHSRRFRYETKNELRNNLSGRDYEKGQHTPTGRIRFDHYRSTPSLNTHTRLARMIISTPPHKGSLSF